MILSPFTLFFFAFFACEKIFLKNFCKNLWWIQNKIVLLQQKEPTNHESQ